MCVCVCVCALQQVTNPPIDPLREGLVMSMEMRLGGRGNLLTPGPDTYRQVLLKSPILLESELKGIANDKTLGTKTFRCVSAYSYVSETGLCEIVMSSVGVAIEVVMGMELQEQVDMGFTAGGGL